MTAVTGTAGVDDSVAAFLYREARLLDEHKYEDWEGLWAPDGVYWIPAGDPADCDPAANVSIIYDDRRRITRRVRQLTSGQRPSQQPIARLRRMVSNIEICAVEDGSVDVAANFLLVVHRGTTRLWSGRNQWLLHRDSPDGAWSLRRKVVALVDAESYLPTIGFLL